MGTIKLDKRLFRSCWFSLGDIAICKRRSVWQVAVKPKPSSQMPQIVGESYGYSEATFFSQGLYFVIRFGTVKNRQGFS